MLCILRLGLRQSQSNRSLWQAWLRWAPVSQWSGQAAAQCSVGGHGGCRGETPQNLVLHDMGHAGLKFQRMRRYWAEKLPFSSFPKTSACRCFSPLTFPLKERSSAIMANFHERSAGGVVSHPVVAVLGNTPLPGSVQGQL